MARHVFIVDERTFKYHLEYMFAGTGKGEDTVSFLVNPNEEVHWKTEKTLVDMISDISRVRTGDEVIFYLTKVAKFYGFFKVKSLAFLSNGLDLKDKMGKRLIFRVLIEPKEVYAKGVPEHIALDSLFDIKKPSEMCWSLIYRKLTGMRGCTEIFPHEAQRLQNLIREANNSAPLNNSFFTYNSKEKLIVAAESNLSHKWEKHSIDIFPRLYSKAANKKSFEAHLQAYLMQNFDAFSKILNLPLNCNLWYSNEVVCSVGEKRIDVLAISETNTEVKIFIIELKCREPYNGIIEHQLQWYVRWCSEYLAPNYEKQVTIIPIVVAAKLNKEKDLTAYKDFAKTVEFQTYNISIESTWFISFDILDKKVEFKREF